jgi:hypothetical protein
MNITVPLLSKRRQAGQLIQKIQHAAPSVLLLGHGASRLTREGDWLSLALGASEVVVSLLVIISFMRALRAWRAHKPPGTRHEAHGHVDWVDIFIGLMLAVEVWAHWHETGHIRRPTLLLVPIMIGLGLAHGRISARSQRRRSLVVDDTGVTIGGRFFTRFDARWSELKRIDVAADLASVVKKDGKTRTIDLGDLTNAAEVRRALEEARARLRANPAPAETAR